MQEIAIEYNSSILSDVDYSAIEQIPQEKEGQKRKEGKEIIELGEWCMHIRDINKLYAFLRKSFFDLHTWPCYVFYFAA